MKDTVKKKKSTFSGATKESMRQQLEGLTIGRDSGLLYRDVRYYYGEETRVVVLTQNVELGSLVANRGVQGCQGHIK